MEAGSGSGGSGGGDFFRARTLFLFLLFSSGNRFYKFLPVLVDKTFLVRHPFGKLIKAF